MNLPVKGSLATTVPLVPMESEEDPSGLGFLPRLLFRGAGDLPNINRDSLLWEQRSTLRATGFCQFLSLQDWLQAFYAEIWPVLKSDPPIVWPEAPRDNVASPRGKILILSTHASNFPRFCIHFFVLISYFTLCQVSRPPLVNIRVAWDGSRTWPLLTWSNLASDKNWSLLWKAPLLQAVGNNFHLWQRKLNLWKSNTILTCLSLGTCLKL